MPSIYLMLQYQSNYIVFFLFDLTTINICVLFLMDLKYTLLDPSISLKLYSLVLFEL